MTWLAVVLGGAVGTAARHAVNLATSRLMSTPVPWATATVNVLGSLVLDFDGRRMDATFIDDKAVVRDYFTIVKGSEPATADISR